MLALFSGNLKISKLLLNYSNLSIRDNNGNTPFILAAANGLLPILEALTENSNNNALGRNFEGQTALHRAAFYGELEVIQFLLKQTKLKLSQVDK